MSCSINALSMFSQTGWACRGNVEIMEEIGSQSSLLMAQCVQRFALLKMRLQ